MQLKIPDTMSLRIPNPIATLSASRSGPYAVKSFTAAHSPMSSIAFRTVPKCPALCRDGKSNRETGFSPKSPNRGAARIRRFGTLGDNSKA
jgi:hypothetical protein